MAKKKSDDFFDKGMDALIKQFGAGFGVRGLAEVKYKAIPTGHDDLDCLLTKGAHGIYQGGIIELFGSEGSGKCVVSDTLCSTPNGLMTVAEIFEYCDLEVDAAQGFVEKKQDLVNGYGEIEPTSHFYRNGYNSDVLKTIRIETKAGFVLEGTHNHPIRVMDDNGHVVWRKLQQIKKGDYACIKRGMGVWNNNSTLSQEEASLLGYLIGDGNLTPKNRFGFTNVDERIVDNFMGNLRSVAGSKIDNKVRKYGIDYHVNDGQFVNRFREKHGLGHYKSVDKRIPATIRCCSKESQASFIRSYFDSDGTFQYDKHNLQFSSASLRLLQELQLMLLNFGIYAYITSVFNSKYNRDYYELELGSAEAIRYLEEIGFNHNDKCDKISSCLDGRKRDIGLGIIKNNTNIDVIPNQQRILQSLYGSIDPSVRNRDLYKLFHDNLSGRCELTYNRLSRILESLCSIIESNQKTAQMDQVHNKKNCSFMNFDLIYSLERLKESNLIFSRITTIEKCRNRTYDFTLPKTHSFWSNGFISHNTSLALRTVGNAQKMGLRCCWLDAESAFDETLAQLNGCDPTQLILPDLAETSVVEKAQSTEDQIQFFNVYEILEMIYRSVISNLFSLIVLDSVAGLMPERILSDGYDPNKSAAPAEVARAMSDMLRKIAPACKKRQTSVIFINQKRDQPGTMYHNPNHTPGGKALKFFAHQRIRVEKKGGAEGQVWAEIDGKKELIGHWARTKIVKNKKAPPVPPGVEIEIPIFYREYFPDNAEKCYKLARELQVITIHKGTLTWKDQDAIILQVTGEAGVLSKIREGQMEAQLAAACVIAESSDRNQKKNNPTKVPTTIAALGATYKEKPMSVEKSLKKTPAIDL